MKLVNYFRDFLKEIRLTDNQIDELKAAHQALRERLMRDEDLSSVIETTFLQGSYRRATAVRPKNGNRSDVDIVVVTKLDNEDVTPEEALDIFEPFLEKYYKGKYKKQGRSWGIEMSHVDLDIVPTSAPSIAIEGILDNEAVVSDDDIEEMSDRTTDNEDQNDAWIAAYNLFFSSDNAENDNWKDEPLLIPDREAQEWDKTNPLAQITWTHDKNKKCNGHYVNVVKCLKWWRKEKYSGVKHPKSYPLEHLIGDCCPDGIESVAEGVVLTLEEIVINYQEKPVLPDRGVEEHDVFSRLSKEDYNNFYDSVCDAAKIARKAYDSDDAAESAKCWRELFGNKFPAPTQTANTVFKQRNEPSVQISGGRFA
ncbi:MAG: nucleotidyltransferase [Clostridia bacterium]|nr:nucleotidyltransferase [Clostridia bacterium]